MTTSGTVATTVIDTSKVIEHAFRRVKVLPSAQTPETVEIARENLYMLLLNLGNRGLNLWCVERSYQGLIPGQSVYTLAAGTLDVVNVAYTTPTLTPSTFSVTTLGGKATLTTPSLAIRIGFKVSSAYTGAITLSSSSDDLVYTTDAVLPSDSYVPGVYYWVDRTIVGTAQYFKVDSSVGVAVSDMVVATGTYDLPLTQWNRDTFLAINNKYQQSNPSTNYFFEKKLNPTITLWPVPTSSYNHLTMFRHRQPQDVGSLIQQLEIPQRWLDGIIWMLADRLGYELPNVDPAAAQRAEQKAQQVVLESELSETDGAPIFLSPNIRVYTR